ncbi:MAG: hypothetical protein AAFV85_28325, partial [Cyanobacteria bacterium J06634_6]
MSSQNRTAQNRTAQNRTAQNQISQNKTSQNYPIAQLPGLSPDQVQQLSDCGISTTFELLRRGNSTEQRHQLSTQLNTNLKCGGDAAVAELLNLSRAQSRQLSDWIILRVLILRVLILRGSILKGHGQDEKGL